MTTYLVTISLDKKYIIELFSNLDIDNIEGLSSMAIDDEESSTNSKTNLNDDNLEDKFETSNLKLYFVFSPNKEKLIKYFKGLINNIDFNEKNIKIEKLKEQNWVKFSEEKREPIEAGSFYIYSAFHRDKIKPNLISVEIEAAEAFGSGHHGSTKGSLIMLDKIFENQNPKKIIDIGCGSGILAIAAAKYLNTNIFASDIDPVSVSKTISNARLNNVANYIQAFESDGISEYTLNHAPYDLIIANILFPVLKELAIDVSKISKEGTNLVLSGLLSNQAQKISKLYKNYGFRTISNIEIEEWTTLHLTKN